MAGRMTTSMELAGVELARAVGVPEHHGDAALRLHGVVTDSRLAAPGEVFFCLRGDIFDGHDFIAAAVDAGAAAVVAAAGEVDAAAFAARHPGVRLLMVPDPLTALGDLAAYWIRRHDVHVVAVTGSNGKTTTKEMTAALLARTFSVHRNHGNFNNLIGVPLTAFEIRREHEFAVLEMGMNRSGEIRRLAEICRPRGVVLTSIAAAHLAGLGSIDAVAAAKGEIFAGLQPGGYAAYNADDARLGVLVERAAAGGTWTPLPVSCREDFPDTAARAAQITAAADGICFNLHLPDGACLPVRLGCWGRHNVGNSLLAAAVAAREGVAPEEIVAGLEAVRPLAGRLQTRVLGSGRTLIDDTYNANPSSVVASLATLDDIRGGRYAVAVLGDMFELGAGELQLHYEVGIHVARIRPDLLVTWGERAREIARGAADAGLPPGAIVAFVPGEDDELVETIRRRAAGEHVILIKGSRGMAMERLLRRLLEAGENP
ncbi:MAG: UDP-N-acetylmuramoyl-tripeptide--D-alanyl-D-alanine ligase [Deltaproteobacteria bacterium]|nr:UDP-N-acetylmuramoyl-tripeptide--D-alanyl-D-alanine ligase [Candidatus Anaeroferrophillacea bacterium]